MAVTGYYWYPSRGKIPLGAIRAGIDSDDNDVLVGRAYHNGSILPAKILPKDKVAILSWNGEQFEKRTWEVLCRGEGSVTWQNYTNDVARTIAVIGGTSPADEQVYIGRVSHEGMLIPGRISTSEGVCYIPYNGQELKFSEYQILVVN